MKYFDHDIRIRYAETDQMGVSYYGNYFTWFEVGRTEYFRALGLPYTEYEAAGIFLPVGEAYCRYYRPVRYDQCITIRTWVSTLKQTSIAFTYTITEKGQKGKIAEGYTTHIFVDSKMKPQRIPADIREKVIVYTIDT
jgi:acyl-CoA thioester hydrolase